MEILDAHGRPINKTILQYSNESKGLPYVSAERSRGVTVYDFSQIERFTGRDKEGRLLSWGTERPYFFLSIQQRIQIAKVSSPIFGVVTSRMNRMAGLEVNITTEKYDEDKIAGRLKDLKNIYQEFIKSTDLSHLTMKAQIYKELIYFLPDLLPDLSNFGNALVRWKRRIGELGNDLAEEAREWIQEPNNGVTWAEFVKKYVYDLLVHGAAGIYKQEGSDGRLENFDLLPGGTVYKLKSPTFSGVAGYVQIIEGLGYYEPQIYFPDEIAYVEYAPMSGRNWGMIPLEALINKVAETLFFDALMAEQADGTKPPEKMLVITRQNPFGGLDPTTSFDLPLDKPEQQRIEEKVNTPVKNSIMTFSGNHAEIVDLSRENTMSIQMQRQKDIREEVALVFNMSNLEVNLTGAEDTSGRSTSVAQQEVEQGKGIAPIAQSLDNLLTRNILPYRYGIGLVAEYEISKDDTKERQLDKMKLDNGEITINELREKYGREGFGEEYDKPQQGGQAQPGMDIMNPQYMKEVF